MKILAVILQEFTLIIITPSIELKESILVSIAFDTIKLVLGFNFLIFD